MPLVLLFSQYCHCATSTGLTGPLVGGSVACARARLCHSL